MRDKTPPVKLKEKRPMTKLISPILDDFFSNYDHDTTERRQHTWIQPYRINSPLKPQFKAPTPGVAASPQAEIEDLP